MKLEIYLGSHLQIIHATEDRGIIKSSGTFKKYHLDLDVEGVNTLYLNENDFLDAHYK